MNNSRRGSSQAIAIAYLRASKDEQRLSGEAQQAMICSWAERHGVSVVASFLDQGVSSVTPIEDRPALCEALVAVREHRAGILVVARRDRLARDPIITAMIERTAAARGATVVSASGEGNGDSPADLFIEADPRWRERVRESPDSSEDEGSPCSEACEGGADRRRPLRVRGCTRRKKAHPVREREEGDPARAGPTGGGHVHSEARGGLREARDRLQSGEALLQVPDREASAMAGGVTVQPGIFCIETADWWGNYETSSVKAILELLGHGIDPKPNFVHRSAATREVELGHHLGRWRRTREVPDSVACLPRWSRTPVPRGHREEAEPRRLRSMTSAT